MQQDELKNLIQRSFLRQEKKHALEAYLDGKGEDDVFYEMFNDYLIEELERRQEQYKNMKTKLDELIAHLDEDLNTKKEEALKQAQEKIAHIPLLNIKEKGNVWDEYDRTLATLYREYETRLKEEASSLITSLL